MRDEGGDVRLDRAATRHPMSIAAGVSHGDEVDPGKTAQNPGVMASHHAEPDETSAQIPHGSGPRRRQGVDRIHDALQVSLAQRRVHRQREALRRGEGGLREVDVDLEGQQFVVRHGVEHP